MGLRRGWQHAAETQEQHMSEMVERVGEALRVKLIEWYAGAISFEDGGPMLARAAIEAMRSQTLVYLDNGKVVHEMRGAPDDIWKTLLDAALGDG